jgi:hypothetical protein
MRVEIFHLPNLITVSSSSNRQCCGLLCWCLPLHLFIHHGDLLPLLVVVAKLQTGEVGDKRSMDCPNGSINLPPLHHQL